MLQVFCILLLLALPLSSSSAEETYLMYIDGNRLLENCEAGPSENKSFCAGYVAAAIDGHVTLTNSLPHNSGAKEPPKPYCLPKGGIELAQAVRVTTKWLQGHPEKSHVAGDVLVFMAMQDGFPCK